MNERPKRMKVISLFSGCGGMDLGFEGDFDVLESSVNLSVNKTWKAQKSDAGRVRLAKTRFDIVFANDIKPEAKAAWVNYFGKKGVNPDHYYLDSIVNLVKREKEEGTFKFPAECDVVIGGFPCQDFSIAGKRMGFASDKGHNGKRIGQEEPTVENRGQLYMWMREVIGITQPKVFIAENVKGLTNLKDVKEVIERDFASVCNGGYLVIPARVINAANYGVPQGRERVIFFGFKKSSLNGRALAELRKEHLSEEYSPYPLRTHYLPEEKPREGMKKFVTVREALGGLDEPEMSADVSQQKYSKAKYMGRHCQGQQEVCLDGIGPTIRSEHHGNIEFRRLTEEHGGRYDEELNAGLKERRLSVRECARIQTFPDDYAFVIPAQNGNKSVSGSEAYKIIGNAVPPLLGYHIAKRLEDNWELYFGEGRGQMDKDFDLAEFEKLCLETCRIMNEKAKAQPSYYLSKGAQKLEPEVKKALEQAALGTIFENKIDMVSGQKFPDIVVAGRFGVEVKSTKDDKWSMVGGSVAEGTRVEGVEHIYVLFGKLHKPVEFRTRRYEDCLYDIAVTHSPRYKIDMELKAGDTIFDRMQISYDSMRRLDNPIEPVVSYYRSTLKPGESLWWINGEDAASGSAPAKIRLWSTLSKQEKEDLIAQGFALFPELFGDSRNKYEKFTLWLVANHGVISASMRDPFSAGGQVNLNVNGNHYERLPQKYSQLFSYRHKVQDMILHIEREVLEASWNTGKVRDEKRIQKWIELVSRHAKGENFDATKLLNDIFR